MPPAGYKPKTTERVCRHCQTHYTKESKPGSLTYYCSRECMSLFKHPKDGLKKYQEKPVRPAKLCPICGKEFVPHNRVICCSEPCTVEFRKRARRVYLENKAKKLEEIVLLTQSLYL